MSYVFAASLLLLLLLVDGGSRKTSDSPPIADSPPIVIPDDDSTVDIPPVNPEIPTKAIPEPSNAIGVIVAGTGMLLIRKNYKKSR